MQRLLLLTSLAAALAACGDNSGPAAVTTAPDAPPAAFAEAPHGIAPTLFDLGGPVLTAPRVQPIFFANDGTMQTQLAPFLTQLAGSSYWHATTAEYGVGDLTVLPTIVTTDAPPKTDDTLAAWIAGNLDGTHTAAGWPAAPDAQTIYAIFTPAGAVVTGPIGTSCQAYGGYHDEVAGAHGEKITYAFMPRCQGGLDSLTITLSHELVEAATDPHPFTEPAYGASDPEHFVMAYTPGAEAGDYCEYLRDAAQQLVGSFYVQRTWSNAASMAGHDPCVPAPTTPFVGAAPLFEGFVGIEGYTGDPQVTKGLALAVNETKKIDVQLFSDTNDDAFDVSAFDAGLISGGSASLLLQFDKASGKNGDVLHLSVTRTAAGTLPGSEFVLSSKVAGSTVSLWWGYVANAN